MVSPYILEQVEALIGRASSVHERNGRDGTSDLNVGSMRLKRWLDSPAFSERSAFEHFLQSNRLTEASLSHCLGLKPLIESNEAEAQAWTVALNDVVQPDASIEQEIGVGAYLNVVQPLIKSAFGRLRDEVDILNRETGYPVIGPGVLESLIDALREQLLLVVIKPLTLELHVARIAGGLSGDTSAERFKHFADELCCQPTRARVFSQYPVMLRHCMRISEQWVESTREFLRRTACDMPRLQSTFGVGTQVVSAQVSSGDAHHRGRRVVIAAFSGGQKLVYKPRPMRTAVRFQELLDWLNKRGLNPKLRTFRVLDAGTYGWSEYVENVDCQSADDIVSFYQRTGALLAVLHAVRATDAHFENLIASGAHPVLVDLETVLQPHLVEDGRNLDECSCLAATGQSVLMVGLLPSPIRVGNQLVDMSGLGAKPDQATPLQTMGFDASGTDAMRVTNVQFSIEASSHLPRLSGEYQMATAHVEPLVAGFRSAYLMMMAHASQMSSPDGPIAAFGDCEVRVLLRPTATYASLLQESHHPMALSDGTEADRILGQIWSGVASNPIRQRTVLREFTQLQQGDIPYFSCLASSTTLLSGDGHQLKSVLSTSGVDAVRVRLERMSEKDLSLQEWIIRASMACLGEADCAAEAPKLLQQRGSSCADWAKSALLATCIESENRASWLTLAHTTTGHPDASLDHQIAEVGIDLYDGLAGIALFLFAYARHLSDDRAFQVGNEVLNEIEQRIQANSWLEPVGAFTGLSGIVYAYAHISHQFPGKSVELQQKAEALLPLIEAKLKVEPAYDLISGRAGIMLCLLAAHSVWGTQSYLYLALECAKDLVGWLRQPPDGTTATLKIPNQRGMSHGYAGIAMALAAIGDAVGDQSFTRAALELTRLESSLVASGGWTDPDDEHHAGQATWCHGAPGIAMARLVTLGHTQDPWVEQEARSALDECLDAPALDNESLCHGALGNLDTFAHAAAAFPRERVWIDKVRSELSELTSTLEHRGLRCSRPNSVTVPGLMTGLSGIGYGALRLSSPEGFPSVLALASPRKAGASACLEEPGTAAAFS